MVRHSHARTVVEAESGGRRALAFALTLYRYTKNGLCHQRGYFIFSAPGSGKTSIVKALAQHYGCTICQIDVDVLETNTNLSAVQDLIHRNYPGPHILLFEDVDRSKIFQAFREDERYNQAGDDDDDDETGESPPPSDMAFIDAPPTDVAMTYGGGGGASTNSAAAKNRDAMTVSSLLNFIDGVIEPKSTRLVIMTANDPTFAGVNRALMRPGRIDRIVAVPPVDTEQFVRIMALFYPDFDLEAHLGAPISEYEIADGAPARNENEKASPIVVSSVIIEAVKQYPKEPSAVADRFTRRRSAKQE